MLGPHELVDERVLLQRVKNGQVSRKHKRGRGRRQRQTRECVAALACSTLSLKCWLLPVSTCELVDRIGGCLTDQSIGNMKGDEDERVLAAVSASVNDGN